MNNKNIKCILFDVDGAVVNSEMFSIQYQKKYGVSNDEMLPFYIGIFQDCLVGKADLKVSLREWLPRWKWKGTADEFLQSWFKAENSIDDKIIKAVGQLRADGVKCYLATKQEKYRTKYMKELMGFEEIFDGIFSSSDIGHKKPDKEFYEYILNDLKNQHNIQANEIIFFDDEQKNVDGAKAVGINAHLYTGFDKYKKIIDKK